MVRTSVATKGCAERGTLQRTLRMKWVRQTPKVNLYEE